MTQKTLLARLRALEKILKSGTEKREGLGFLQVLIDRPGFAGATGDADIVGLQVGGFDGTPAVTVVRISGESLDALEARANPAGCWRAAPRPVFRDAVGWEELAEMLWLSANSWRGVLPW